MATPLRVLVVNDDPGMRDGVALSLKRSGLAVDLAQEGAEALRLAHQGGYDAVVADLHPTGMDGLELSARLKAVDPVLPVLLIGAADESETARLAAFEVLYRPFSADELRAAVQKAVASEGHLKAAEPSEAPLTLTQDPALGETLAMARRAADSRATILIQGENGTGKEILAQLIHGSSSRHDGPLVILSCATLPEEALEAELFGAERGAHPGSASKPGSLERAEGGTLVLDAVDALPPGLQGRLLRILQERPGSGRPAPMDVRLISLTSQDLLAEVKAGRFSEDLYYRLNVIPLNLPPLRERPGDLNLLAEHFAERYARENGREVPELTPGFFAALARHPWTGNLRELENVIQRCVVLNQGHRLTRQDLHWLMPSEAFEGLPPDPPAAPLAVGAFQASSVSSRPDGSPAPAAVLADPRKPLVGLPLGTPVTLPLGLSLPELERFWLLSTLSALRGNRTHCATQLDIALRTVRNKINEYKADGFSIPPSQRGRDGE